MGGPDVFELILPSHFCSGQTVSGNVKIASTSKLTNINNIQVKIVGFAHVQWNEAHKKIVGNRKRGRTVEEILYYENHQDYSR